MIENFNIRKIHIRRHEIYILIAPCAISLENGEFTVYNMDRLNCLKMMLDTSFHQKIMNKNYHGYYNVGASLNVDYFTCLNVSNNFQPLHFQAFNLLK